MPLAHLTQRQSFLGLELLAGPGGADPAQGNRDSRPCGARQDRLHGEEARRADGDRHVHRQRQSRARLRVLRAARARLCVDLSADAVTRPARKICNSRARRARRRAHRRSARAFRGPEIHRSIDFLSCNPPYISAAKVKEMHPEISRHEPEAAFNGGVYGVSILMKLVKNAPRFLRPGGWLAFEVGPWAGPGPGRSSSSANPAFAGVETYADAAGEIRGDPRQVARDGRTGIERNRGRARQARRHGGPSRLHAGPVDVDYRR